MAWIESHTTLDRHPKAMLLRRRMRWSKNETIGFLHRFWWTVLDYAPNGVVSALSREVFAESLDMDSETIDRTMAEMEAVGLLRRVGEIIFVNDWLEYAGRYLRDTKFKRSPQRMAEVIAMYQKLGRPPPPDLLNTRPPTVGGQSADSPPYLTNQPNQPTNPPGRGGGVKGGRRDPAAEIKAMEEEGIV